MRQRAKQRANAKQRAARGAPLRLARCACLQPAHHPPAASPRCRTASRLRDSMPALSVSHCASSCAIAVQKSQTLPVSRVRGASAAAPQACARRPRMWIDMQSLPMLVLVGVGAPGQRLASLGLLLALWELGRLSADSNV